MKTTEAIEICDGWFAHLERQRQRAVDIQKLAAMARAGQQEEAQRRMRKMDNRSVTVYDGARLEPAVKHLIKIARASNPTGIE
jgi:hypothetical protein